MPEIRTKATLDRSQFDAGLEGMKTATKQLNQSLGSIGGMAAGVFGGNFITSAVQSAFSFLVDNLKTAHEEMVQMGRDSENIGITPQQLDEVSDAFAKFGVSGERVVQMFGYLDRARQQALDGNKQMIKSFDDLGISLKDLTELDPKELLDRVSAASATTGGRQMQDIFGRGGSDRAMNRALRRYGQGERWKVGLGPTDEDVIAEQLAGVNRERWYRTMGNAWKKLTAYLSRKSEHEYRDQVTMNKVSPALGFIQWIKNTFGASQEDIDSEMKARTDQAKRDQQRDAETLKRNQKEASDYKMWMDAEEKRYTSEKTKAREEEMLIGAKLSPMSADAFRKKGLITGNAAATTDSLAYSLGRQQLSVQQQILEMNRRIAKNTEIQRGHQTRVAQIKAAFPGAEDMTDTMGGGVE